MRRRYATTTRFGIYNSVTKKWRGDIVADTPWGAQGELYRKIGKFAYQWRWEVRALPIGKRGIPYIPMNGGGGAL